MHVQVGTWKEHDKQKSRDLDFLLPVPQPQPKKRKRKEKRDRKNIPPFGGCRSIDRSEKARDELASVFCRITTGFFPLPPFGRRSRRQRIARGLVAGRGDVLPLCTRGFLVHI
jgi:hypothetical protein